MRISPIRTIWVTTFSILAMLMSSLAFSAPLMTFQMLSQNQSTSTISCTSLSSEDFSNSSTPGHHLMHHSLAHDKTKHNEMAHQDLSKDCGMDDDTVMNCCGASCPVSFAMIGCDSFNSAPLSRRAQWPLDSTIDLLYQTKSLYRPPIA